MLSMQKTNVKSQAGFSLIELMVVVAIIGLLATVAIPQFQKFQSRAKQGEAQSTLTAIYTAEASFFSQYNQYFGGLVTAGFAPVGRLRYNAGFTALGVALPPQITAQAANDGFNIGAMTAPLYAGACAGVGQQSCGLTEFTTAGAIAGAVNPTAAVFTAVAISKLTPAAVAIDTWSVDQNKTVQNTVSGI